MLDTKFRILSLFVIFFLTNALSSGILKISYMINYFEDLKMTVKSKIIFTTISLFAVAGISATVFFGCSSNNLNIQTTTTIPTTLAALELGYKDGNKVIEIEEGGAVKAADLPIECAGAGKLAIVYSDNTAEKTFEKSGDYSVTAEVTDLSTGRVGTIAFTVRVSAPQTTAPTTAKATQAHTQAKTTKKSSSGSNSGTASKKATSAQKATKKSSSGSSAKPKSTTKKSSSSGSGKKVPEEVDTKELTEQFIKDHGSIIVTDPDIGW